MFTPSSSLNSSDLRDGDGEWKNVPEVLRDMFLSLLEITEKQARKTSKLESQVASLTSQLTSRTTVEEIESIIEIKFKNHKRKGSKSNDRNENDFRVQMSKLQLDIEGKAEIKYVDHCLRKSLEKSALLISEDRQQYRSSTITTPSMSLGSSNDLHGNRASNTGSYHTSNSKDYSKAFSSQMVLSSKEKEKSDTFRDRTSPTELQRISNELYDCISLCPSRVETTMALNAKVDTIEMETVMLSKVDKHQIMPDLMRLETNFRELKASTAMTLDKYRSRVDSIMLGTKQIQSVNSALATLEGQAARINDFLQLNSLTGMTGRNKHLRPLSLLDHLSDLKIMIGTKQDKLKGL